MQRGLFSVIALLFHWRRCTHWYEVVFWTLWGLEFMKGSASAWIKAVTQHCSCKTLWSCRAIHRAGEFSQWCWNVLWSEGYFVEITKYALHRDKAASRRHCAAFITSCSDTEHHPLLHNHLHCKSVTTSFTAQYSVESIIDCFIVN